MRICTCASATLRRVRSLWVKLNFGLSASMSAWILSTHFVSWSFTSPAVILDVRAVFSPQFLLFTYEGAARRYPGGLPDKVRLALAHVAQNQVRGDRSSP